MSKGFIYCSQCGQQNPEDVKFCSNCGSEILRSEKQPPDSSVPPEQPAPPQEPAAYTPPPSPQAYPPPAPQAYTGPRQGTPAYAPPPPRPKKSGAGLRTCGILLVVLVCLCGATAVAGWFFGDKVVNAVAQQFPDLEKLLKEYLGTEVVNPIIEDRITGDASLSVTTSTGGKVSSSNGASITIPPGAVPPMEDGNAGTMVFNIEEAPSMTPSLSGDFQPLGPVYSLGPEGFIFSIPVEITLPIPEDVDPEAVMGLTYYDTATETWKMLPGAVDIDARTVSVTATHFSYWGLFGRCGMSTLSGCHYDESLDGWNREHGGWIKVVNSHTYNTGSFPGGRHLGMSSGYGVCIQSYAFDNPNEDAWNWLEPNNWKIMAYDSNTSSFWMPRGQYNLVEFISLSEINNNIMYVPEYTTYWRSIGSYTITAGDTLEFKSSNADYSDGSFTEGRPPCWGAEDTSVGTGDVQVTLTWQTNDDIDLYVTDPTGETVSYITEFVSSGGELDRDNKCGDLIIGRPENIYWPQGGAPSGTYIVQVNYFGTCDIAHPVNWTVRVIVQGNVQTFTGTLNEEYETQDVTTFTVP
jgi:hypothetical protein